MRSLKIFALFSLACCMFLSLNAQGIYFNVNGGYTVQSLKDRIDLNEFGDSTGFMGTQDIEATLGGGVSVGADVGYMFNKHVGAELGFQFFSSETVVAKRIDNPILNLTARVSTQQGRATAGAIVQTGTDNKLNGYVRTGAILPVFGHVDVEVESSSSFFNTERLGKSEDRGKFSIGMYGGLGGEFSINDLLAITGEVHVIALRIKSESRTTTSIIDLTNGEELVGTISTSSRDTVYVDILTQDSNNTEVNQAGFDTDLPTELMTYTSNYSGMGVRLGLKIRL